MKWQEFYFKWLEDVGYFKWWNATLIGNKRPSPVGGRTNIGTVGFGGNATGGSPIEGLPSIPTVSHPAQSLIDTALENTEPLDSNAIRRMRNRRGVGGLNGPLLAYLGGNAFGEGQKNTLRYWGVQPEGSTFLPDSNFYRGYEYYINAMKQKYELRGPRGSRLLTEKDWLSDRQNRTYPTTRRPTFGNMIVAKHPDYQDYADIGNIMQIEWGVLNGYSKTVYSPTWPQETSGVQNVEFGDFTVEDQEAYENTEVDEAEAWLNEQTQAGKDVIMRNKIFDEKYYASSYLRHEVLQNMTTLLLTEIPDISMITAETILQYLSIDLVGLNLEGHPSVPEGYEGTLEALPLSSETILQLQRLLQMYQNNDIRTYTFYLDFPCSSTFLVPKTTNQPSNVNVVTFGQNLSSNRPNDNSEIAGGTKTLNNAQGVNIPLINFMLGSWETYTIVDEALQPFITAFRDMFNIMVSRNDDQAQGIASLARTVDEQLCQRMTAWLYTVPTWVNVDYAIAVASYFGTGGDGFGSGTGLDILPKEMTFDLGGTPKYAYDISLSEWWPLYQHDAPTTSDLRFWRVHTTFLHPSTKKTRGMATPELIEVHAISLNTLTGNPVKFNKMGVSSVVNAEALMVGAVENPDDVPQITYKFWDAGGKYWPQMNVTVPDNSPQGGYGRRGSGNQGNIGSMRSFLTPMTTIHNEWWNEFLGPNGILSMEITPTVPPDPQNPDRLGNGWEIGWGWNYMENVIWTSRLREIDWAIEIDLEDFAERVYPTTSMKVHFEPKISPTMPLVNRGDGRGASFHLARATKSTFNLSRITRKNLLWAHGGDSDNLTPVMQKRWRLEGGRSDAYELGYENPNNYVTVSVNNKIVAATEEDPTNTEPNIFSEGANQLRRQEWTWREFKRGGQSAHFGNCIIMEDDNGNLAFLPDNTPYSRNFDDEKWAEVRGASGYMSDSLAWMGSYESRLNRAMGRDSEITYADVPKIIIEDIPDDIFEMEELTNLEGKTIDYTAPTSSPWRRGKIPLINWAAILSNRVLSMMMPPEE